MKFYERMPTIVGVILLAAVAIWYVSIYALYRVSGDYLHNDRLCTAAGYKLGWNKKENRCLLWDKKLGEESKTEPNGLKRCDFCSKWLESIEGKE